MSAKDAKNGFGFLLDTARAEPVTIEKHGRAVVVVVSVEEYERLKGLEDISTSDTPNDEQQGA
ncbi:MAG: type II toxin-antitoxin system prevent-host-death family antitoxin [Candidatus Thiodiazotropha sp.]